MQAPTTISQMPVMPDMPKMPPNMRMQPKVDYYSLMKFKMYSSVTYKAAECKITGWSTNAANEDVPTFCYQLNNSGELVQESDLLLENTPAVPDAVAAAPEAAAAAPDAAAAAPDAAAAAVPDAVAAAVPDAGAAAASTDTPA